MEEKSENAEIAFSPFCLYHQHNNPNIMLLFPSTSALSGEIYASCDVM